MPSTTISPKLAIKLIQDKGILLVFPIKNDSSVPSLWSEFFPGDQMRWEWNDTGDDRVVELWFLREKLASSLKIIYSKWFQNRATVMSPRVFQLLLAKIHRGKPSTRFLTAEAKQLLAQLEDNSPQSTKELKAYTRKKWGWENKVFEHSLRELWKQLLIVGVGEVADGAFPSLNIGATKLIFEDIWQKAHTKDWKKCSIELEKYVAPEAPWYVQISRIEVEREKNFKSQLPKAKDNAIEKTKKLTINYHDLVKPRR